MQHPVFSNKKVLITFVFIVLLFMISDVVLIHFSNKVDILNAFINALTYDFTIVILGLFLWYPVYFIDKSKGFVSLGIELVILAVIFLAIGIGSSIGLVSMFLNLVVVETNVLKDFLVARFLIGLLVFILFLAVYYLFISIRNEEDYKKQQEKLKSLLKETELNLLKSQLNPHFLFNSLNSISALTITNPSKAQQMIIKLSEFLRYGLRNNEETFVELDRELDNLSRYIDIEKERFGEKINFSLSVGDVVLKKRLPALILQPLIENAIKYGVYESVKPVEIKLQCEVVQGDLQIFLANQFDSASHIHKGEGVGLKNTLQRMQRIFNRNNLVEIKESEDWFSIILIIPQFKV